MGPFKHTVDDGLDLRKAAFECMYTLMETCLEQLDIFQFLRHIEDGLKDHYDIRASFRTGLFSSRTGFRTVSGQGFHSQGFLDQFLDFQKIFFGALFSGRVCVQDIILEMFQDMFSGQGKMVGLLLFVADVDVSAASQIVTLETSCFAST